jgi:WD40 repeat protein
MQTGKLSALVCLSLACHDGSNTTEPAPTESAPVVEQQAELVELPGLPGIALAHAGHRDEIVDIVLCPNASAALTLDRNGGVRLWTTLDGTREPLIVPIDDPSSLSLARTETGYTLATLDTIGGAEVYELREHGSELRLELRFSIPPTDPLFELHVLDGGQRLLALGVDHRVRLYDAHGNLLSSIAEHGFVPWQLRHIETEAGVTLVAILAGPTRVQPLELRDDHLQIIGEPFAVQLDRGPNRNDLALTPDGQHIAAFSRRKWRSGEWQLHLHSLADGKTTLIEGKSLSESEERPRVHLLDGDRMLLDDGTGFGELISLDPSVPTRMTRPLPGSSERARLFTSVEQGIRVVPSGAHFIVDHLDDDEHLRIGHERARMRGAGLSPDGTRVIWAFVNGWAVESLDAASRPAKPNIHAHSQPLIFADFVDDDHVLLVSETGTIELVHPVTGTIKTINEAPRRLSRAQLARLESPMLMVRDRDSKLDLLLEIETEAITERTRVAANSAFIGPWYPAEIPSAWISMAGFQAGWWGSPLDEVTLETELAIALNRPQADIHDMATTPDGARVFAASSSSSELLVRTRPNDIMRVGQLEAKSALGPEQAHRLAASPSGDSIVVIYANGHISGHDARTLERHWARVDTEASALGWSADGTRLVVAGESGGLVLDAESGEIELERRDLGLHVERKQNLVPVPQFDSTSAPQLPDR